MLCIDDILARKRDILVFGRMIYRNKLRMIYNGKPLILVRLCAIINSLLNKNFTEERKMKKLTKEAEAILIERFGKDSIIALATTADGTPYVRKVNAFYFDGAFYVLTYGLSNKMKQIAENPVVAITGDWFTAHGKGVNLGYFGKEENKEIANLMRTMFAEWIDNGHNNFDDVNTCILRIELTHGLLLSHGTRYDIDFSK